jgi:hypothetical protein
MFLKFALVLALVIVLSGMALADIITDPSKTYWSYGPDIVSLVMQPDRQSGKATGSLYLGGGLSAQNNSMKLSVDLAVQDIDPYDDKNGNTTGTLSNSVLTVTGDYYVLHPHQTESGVYVGVGFGYRMVTGAGDTVNSPVCEAVLEFRGDYGGAAYIQLQDNTPLDENTDSMVIGFRIAF